MPSEGSADACAIEEPRLDPIDEARTLWQPLTSRPLSREDGREIIANVTNFFAILREWASAERIAPRAAPPEPRPLDDAGEVSTGETEYAAGSRNLIAP